MPSTEQRDFLAAKVRLLAQGVMLTQTGFDDELRVNIKGSCEATAYYTDDLEDAVGTGIQMAKDAGAYREPLLEMA